jgi:hypothetical protein
VLARSGFVAGRWRGAECDDTHEAKQKKCYALHRAAVIAMME